MNDRQIPQQQGNPIGMQQQPQQMPVQHKKKPTFDRPKVDDKTRLILKQTAFKSAVELVGNMAFEEKTYEELIEEVRTLTAEFYNIIIEYNETMRRQS